MSAPGEQCASENPYEKIMFPRTRQPRANNAPTKTLTEKSWFSGTRQPRANNAPAKTLTKKSWFPKTCQPRATSAPAKTLAKPRATSVPAKPLSWLPNEFNQSQRAARNARARLFARARMKARRDNNTDAIVCARARANFEWKAAYSATARVPVPT